MWTTIGFGVGSPISVKYFDIQSAYIIALEKPIYFASTIDNATVFCLLLSHDTGPSAMMKMFPFVEWHVSLQSTKSESTYLVRLSLASALYVIL